MRKPDLTRVLKNGPHRWNVTRSTGSFDFGGWVEGEPLIIEDMKGLVTPTNSKDIEQLPEGDRITGSLTFYSCDALYVTRNAQGAPATSDRITYNGEVYRIMKVLDYLSFGYNKAIGVRLSGD